MLFISQRKWKTIRELFTEDEKATLRTVIVQQVMAPVGGWDLDVDKLEAGLYGRLLNAVLSNTAEVRTGR